MIIIHTCPKCGHDLLEETLAVYPPIPRKICTNCGWQWMGKPTEQVVRVPFNEFTDIPEEYNLYTQLRQQDNIPAACRCCPKHPSNGGDGICNCTAGLQPINYTTGAHFYNTTSTTVDQNMKQPYTTTASTVKAV